MFFIIFIIFILYYSLCVFQNSFHFPCSPLQKKSVCCQKLFPLLGGVNSQKNYTKKCKHNPSLRGKGGF